MDSHWQDSLYGADWACVSSLNSSGHPHTSLSRRKSSLQIAAIPLCRYFIKILKTSIDTARFHLDTFTPNSYHCRIKLVTCPITRK